MPGQGRVYSSGFHTKEQGKGGKRVSSCSLGNKEFYGGCGSHRPEQPQFTPARGRGTQGKLCSSVSPGDDPALEPRVYVGSFLSLASEVPGI